VPAALKAAAMFARRLERQGQLAQVRRIEVRLYGSLGATGKGHGTDTAGQILDLRFALVDLLRAVAD
jgi:hypothetical protein